MFGRLWVAARAGVISARGTHGLAINLRHRAAGNTRHPKIAQRLTLARVLEGIDVLAVPIVGYVRDCVTWGRTCALSVLRIWDDEVSFTRKSY